MHQTRQGGYDMSELIKLEILDETVDVERQTTMEEIAKRYADRYDDDIVLAVYNGKLCELRKKIKQPGTLKFLTTADRNGRRAYCRSVVFLMQRAVERLCPKEKPDIRVMFSLDNGYFCRMDDENFVVDEKFLSDLKAEMLSLVKEDLPLDKYAVHTREAEAMFRERGMESKEKLLRYRSSSNTNIYDLDGCVDYFYGYMVPSTGFLKYFDLSLYKDGFMLLFPRKNMKQVDEFNPSGKLYSVLRTSARWSDTLDIPTVGALNDAISKGRTGQIILMQEALMEERIGSLAAQIAQDPSKKFVMIAGPSSSGKTTFSHRLSVQLEARGIHPHPIPLDDYYLNRDQMPLDEFGEKDFEALEGLDIELFNSDMNRLLKGERVLLPSFNFTTGKREYKDKYLQIGADDVLVIEGIHGLNDKLSYSLPVESKFKIYISALTQLAIDEHNPLSTTDGRLIRRIVRDARTRGTSAKETIAMWDSVRRGEEKNIFPFQEGADAMFNSALVYEMAVMKIYAVPQLFAIPRDCPEYVEAKRLLKLMDYFLPIPTEDIPKTSLIREFIGGSCFKV